MKSVLAVAIGLVLFATPSFAMSESECTALWTKADTNGDGVVSGAEADSYSAMMRIGNKEAPADASYSKSLFLENCKLDIFKISSTDAGAPLAGLARSIKRKPEMKWSATIDHGFSTCSICLSTSVDTRSLLSPPMR